LGAHKTPFFHTGIYIGEDSDREAPWPLPPRCPGSSKPGFIQPTQDSLTVHNKKCQTKNIAKYIIFPVI
jgi:hypothetical protein